MTATPTRVDGREEQHKHFAVSSRRMIAEGSDMFVKEFVLMPQEEVPWHSHTNVFDIFFCLEGRLEISCFDIFSGLHQPQLDLGVGDSARVEAGMGHRPFNPGPGICRFLIVQGVGEYDFLPFKGPEPRSP